MKDTLFVRNAEFSDHALLEAFYHEAYGDEARHKFPELWNWQFRDNPWVSEDRPPVYIVGNSSNGIVGHLAMVLTPTKFFEQTSIIRWGMDLIVLPESRRSGVGARLIQASLPYFSLSMSAATLRIKKKLEIKHGPSAGLFVKFLRYSGLSARHRTTAGLDSLIVEPLLYWPVRLMQTIKEKKSRWSAIRISGPTTTGFGSAEDVLWAAVRDRYDFATERSSEYLNWRYRDCPCIRHWCIRVHDASGETCGLVIYRLAVETSPPIGIILELFDRDEDHGALRALLSAAEKHLRRLGAAQIQVASSDPAVAKVIGRTGYLRVREVPLVITGSNDLIDRLSPQSRSLLTKGDQDWDRYPRAIGYSPLECVKKSILARMPRLERR